MSKIALLIGLSVLSISCTKQSSPDDDNVGQGPDATVITSGHLSTMGKGYDGYIDTLTYFFNSGAQDMGVYGKDYQILEDELSFIADGNGHVYIKRKGVYKYRDIPYQYFGITENISANSLFPEHKYIFDFYQPEKSVTNLFTIKRNADDNKKFTIESLAYPGYFLGTAKWAYDVYPTETRLTFTTNAQVFFFL